MRAALLVGTLLLLAAWAVAVVGEVAARFSDQAQVGANTFSTDTLNPPTGLTATGGASIVLNWTATADTYASGHRVLRSTTPGGPYTQIAQVTPRTTTTYWDNPTAGTYYYVVRAYYRNWRSLDSSEASATTSSTVLIGVSNVESSVDTNPVGMAEAFQYTASVTGTATTLSVYLDSTNTETNVVVGIYTQSGSTNDPQTLLTQGTITNPVAGAWNSVSISATPITSGTQYWIAILGPTSGKAVKFRDLPSGGGPARTSSQTNLVTLPSTWSSGNSYNNSPMSGYATQ